MSTVAILSHKNVAAELSILGEWLDQGGYEVSRFYREEPWDKFQLLSADLLIVMGSPNSTAAGYEDESAAKEIDLAKSRIASDQPYFGICFGAQIMGRAIGAQVVRRDKTNIGYKTVNAQGIDQGSWMLWHEDMILPDSLPESTEILATDSGAVIAFRLGSALGVQFHPEVDGDALGRMIAGIGISEDQWGPVRDAMNADDANHRVRAFALFDLLATSSEQYPTSVNS